MDGRDRLEELHCVAGGAENELRVEGFGEFEAALDGESAGVLERGLEVVAVLDEFYSLGEHGLILLRAVAVGDDDDGLEAEDASGEAYSLAVIAASGGDDASE